MRKAKIYKTVFQVIILNVYICFYGYFNHLKFNILLTRFDIGLDLKHKIGQPKMEDKKCLRKSMKLHFFWVGFVVIVEQSSTLIPGLLTKIQQMFTVLPTFVSSKYFICSHYLSHLNGIFILGAETFLGEQWLDAERENVTLTVWLCLFLSKITLIGQT